MNAFKKLNDKPIFNETNFPSLKKIEKTPSINSSLNFLDTLNKPITKNDTNELDNSKKDWCTIYYDKKLKKVVYQNLLKKNNYDKDTDSETDSETNTEIDSLSDDLELSFKNQKNKNNKKPKNNLKLQYGMNKAIRIIMENRDRFIDQYGVDEFIRDYLPKDSPYLYSRYYYKNKYINYYKNKYNSQSNTNVTENVENQDIPINELDIINYEDIEDEDEDIMEDELENDDEII